MASRVLYPPSIASSLPAFTASSEVLRVPISFSKFNNIGEFVSAHISIVKKDTGMNVVNTNDDLANGRYRATGIILNVPVLNSMVDGENIYYVEIRSSDLKSKKGDEIGWVSGWYYKIQVRLSSVNYMNMGENKQQDWLTTNASNFSEWSTVCIVKAIGDITIDASSFDYTYHSGHIAGDTTTETYGNSLIFTGKYSCLDPTENLASYRVKLYSFPKSTNSTPLDDSGDIYNTAVNVNEFNYVFKIRPESHIAKYVIDIEYSTINGFSDKFEINFTLSESALDPIGARVITVDSDIYNIFDGISTVAQEEDEGRIALKLYAADSSPYSGNLCIRRADSRTNFTIWEDVKIITFKQQTINSAEMWYDYTIESGVWYKYGVQVIDERDERSEMNITAPILRNFNYAYLLGENNQQLKLMFDNEMGSFTRQVSESHIDTIGGKYSVFSRNAITDYKVFPIEGLISFWMDEQNTFTNKLVLYGDSEIVSLYNDYNNTQEINQYDYIQEREFRKLVSDFLYDGKPKLFKSPTEGNVIIRLSEVGMTPKQELSRLIYNFSSTGYEIAESNIENYKKYNLLKLDSIETDLSVSSYKLGQIIGEFNVGDNIFNLIYQKYYKENVIGYTYDIGSIIGIRIQIEDKPMRVINSSNNYVLGYNLRLDGRLITLRNGINYYELDPMVEFTRANSLILLGDADNKVKKLNIVVDFLYEEKVSEYTPKKPSSRTVINGMGQIYGSFEPNTSLYRYIYNKYTYDWNKSYSKLNKITSVEIEAIPGVAFQIQDTTEDVGEVHVVNDTGVLALTEISDIIQIRYLGIMDDNGEIQEIKTGVMINYYYTVVQGGYQ